ncbi:uncharacterized protein L969DRAFT_87307 [Mixia osmundae IAM 14324]|uniref:Uncharacterized protein n=1 Tax=Mixia osmundae (strain CBS 9802 / IAM 14324 / JCM 22182 / KY 12970) TaxID=764103 RepID=G7E3F8_MIXOS|nr:uncharacterized protein L969DRAFT_87307 [Mixia osmundae IAM 14324]KEI39354.1 hypothetical protein L969DRAFT_87307 [Mixia osmundae IAM 14324]GAA97368.1 hypothetical protein E5Q_04046 [Mixia osmundae IAM 14324]
MDSLAPECTRAKQEYDACFHTWLDGYLNLVVLRPGSSSQAATPDSSQAPSSGTAQSAGSSFSLWGSNKGKERASATQPTAGDRSLSSMTEDERQKAIKSKIAEYDAKCGSLWTDYRSCLQNGIKAKGLDDLIAAARAEDPLLRPSDEAFPTDER